MKVIVTGANGFLGSWVCRILQRDHNIIGLMRSGANENNLFGIQGIQEKRIEELDFNKVVAETSPDVVILCDWWGVGNKFRNDLRQFTNVQRIRDRITSLKHVPTVIGIGSQAELGSEQNIAREVEIDSPTTKYGQAKVEARKVLESELDSNVRLIWGRVFSTYGPLDSESWFIPGTIRKLLNNESVALTKGEQEWSFLHSYDLGLALKAIIENQNVEGIVNIGNPNTQSIYEVAQFIGDALKRRELLKFGQIPYREDQVMRLSPQTLKLSRIGWSPKIELETGISHLINWMSEENPVKLKTIDGYTIDLSLPSYFEKNNL